MRSPTTLLLAAVLLLGALFGLFVMWRTPTGGIVSTAGMPAVLGGRPQGHVYTGFIEEPGDVNPFTTHDAVARSLVLAYTHDTLLDRDPATAELRPSLAESWQVSDDGLQVTFVLRAGVTFSDGSPVADEDVMFGWELRRAGHLAFGACESCFGAVADAALLDGRRLQVTLRQRHYAGVDVVGEGWIVARRQFFVDRVAARLADGEQMPAVDSARFAELLKGIKEECGPGTGPYALHNEPGGAGAWRPSQDLLLVRNEGSWRRRVFPGTWNFAGMRLLFRDDAGGTAALLRGELDWFSRPTLAGLCAAHPQLERDYHRYRYDFFRLGFVRIVWNCKQPGLDDPRVRRALDMLIDRGEVVKVFDGAAKPATAHARPGSAGYPQLPATSCDPSAARRLLREAGYDPAAGRTLRLRVVALGNNEQVRRISELFAAACKQAGVELVLRPRDNAGFVAEKNRDEWGGALLMHYLDMAADPYRFLHTKGADNDGHFSDAEVDRLLEEAQVELDPARRAELWRRAHTRVHELQPAALIVHPMATVLFSRHIQGVEPGPLGLRPERGWVEPEFQRR
ncbi:MAG: ABC transporter substrate-binding protein [Planctomycetes bacterium]|nr:ABC transporter substrate-binding protein [Planctomycetota bacterium]